MKKTKLKKLIISVFCVALCLATGVSALGDYTWDMPISFVVTAEMLPPPTTTPTFVVPTATPKPTAYPSITPLPTPLVNKDIVKTGDDAPVFAIVVVLTLSLLVLLIVYHYIKTKEGTTDV